mgnify:CR=1 FL=1
MEAQMKNMLKTTAIAGVMLTLGACSSMTTIAERDEYAQPKWHASYFWWKEEFAYACGAGESVHQQAAEEQMYAIAMNNFAKRINGKVNSETNLSFVNDVKQTSTRIAYTVEDTSIVQHLEEERSTYVYNSKQYTFVKLKMPKIVFDQLLAQNTVATVND